MCIYSPMPHTLSYCALIGKCALIRSNTVFLFFGTVWVNFRRRVSAVNWSNRYFYGQVDTSIMAFNSMLISRILLLKMATISFMLTHCILVDSSTVIYWSSLFVIFGVLCRSILSLLFYF